MKAADSQVSYFEEEQCWEKDEGTNRRGEIGLQLMWELLQPSYF